MFLVVWGIKNMHLFSRSCSESSGIAPASDGTKILAHWAGKPTCRWIRGWKRFLFILCSLLRTKIKTKHHQFFMTRTFKRDVNSQKRRCLFSDFLVALKNLYWTVTADLTGCCDRLLSACVAHSQISLFSLPLPSWSYSIRPKPVISFRNPLEYVFCVEWSCIYKNVTSSV